MILSQIVDVAFAGEPWLRPSELPEGRNQGSLLKTLQVMPSQIVLSGEAAGHTWSVLLDSDEAARTSRFQLGYLNAVSVLPLRSRLTVLINNRPVAEILADASESPSLVSVPLPPGLMRPGLNSVTVATTLTTRSDCRGTCDLWAEIEPALSGFMLELGPDPVARPPADLTGAPVASARRGDVPRIQASEDDDAVPLRRAAPVDADLFGSGVGLASDRVPGAASAQSAPRPDDRQSGESQPDLASWHGQGIGPGRLAVMVLLSGIGPVMPPTVRNAEAGP